MYVNRCKDADEYEMWSKKAVVLGDMTRVKVLLRFLLAPHVHVPVSLFLSFSITFFTIHILGSNWSSFEFLSQYLLSAHVSFF